ncbi:hypothetical protein BJX99DRAFT_218505, partial [Aspergillus californicus]
MAIVLILASASDIFSDGRDRVPVHTGNSVGRRKEKRGISYHAQELYPTGFVPFCVSRSHHRREGCCMSYIDSNIAFVS